MAERLYNVVIEHPRSPAPGAGAALAAAIAARYGIPAPDLERRLARGRFKVKSRVDKNTADTYAADLTRLGAVCMVQAVDEAPPGTTGQYGAVSGPIDMPDDTSQVRSMPRASEPPPLAAPRAHAPTPAPPMGPPPAQAPARWPSEAPRTEMSEPPRMAARPSAPAQVQPQAPAKWPSEAPRTEMTEPPRMAAPAQAQPQAPARWPSEAPRTEMTEPPRMPDPAPAARPPTDPSRARVSADALRPPTDQRARIPAEAVRPDTEPSRARIPAEAVRPDTEPSRARIPAEAVRPATEPQRARIPAEAVRPATEPQRARIPAEAVRPATEPQRARIPAEAARPAPEPPRARAPETPRAATEPPRARIPAEAGRSATEPLKPWGPGDPARPPTERGARVPSEAVPPPSPPARPAAPPLPLSPPPMSSPGLVPPPVAKAATDAGAGLDLGALSGGLPMTLSTLDGANPDAGAAARVAQNASLPASFGPPPALESAPPAAPLVAFKPSQVAPPSSTPLVGVPMMAAAAPAEVDRFAPPKAAVELEMTLDTAAPSRRELAAAAARTSAQRAAVPEVAWPASTLPPRISDARPGSTLAAPAADATARAGLDPHLRLIVGAVLAVGLGFIPAHFVGKMREDAAYQDLDAELARREATIRSREDYDAFGAVRAATADRKRSARQNIALTSIALWGLVGGGVAWLWFRRIAPIR